MNKEKKQRPTELERFWSKVNKTDGCWLWTGYIGTSGYGKFRTSKGKSVTSSRYIYKVYHGEFDQKLLCCHSCDVRHCVKPDHLFLGTDYDNCMDAVNKGRKYYVNKHNIHINKTHCPHGHEYSKENTAIRKTINKLGISEKRRACKECCRTKCLKNRLKKTVLFERSKFEQDIMNRINIPTIPISSP